MYILFLLYIWILPNFSYNLFIIRNKFKPQKIKEKLILFINLKSNDNSTELKKKMEINEENVTNPPFFPFNPLFLGLPDQ